MTVLLADLLLVGLFGLVVSLALAPIESLGWWAGWLGPESDEAAPDRATPSADPPAEPPACYVVFLSGIGSISGDELLPQETAFLDRLALELPDAQIVRDVFPYAPSGRQLLTGQRFFTWVWRRVLDWRLNGTRLLPAILNVRNLFQVLVSADHRYGPLYSFGIAQVARERLRAHGYAPGSGRAGDPARLERRRADFGWGGGLPRGRGRRAARDRDVRRRDVVRPRRRGRRAACLALRVRGPRLRARANHLPRTLVGGGVVLERRPARGTAR